MKVMKFGGSSLATATAMSGVLDIVYNAAREDRVVLVCSAISGCTDALISQEKTALDAIRARHEGIITRLFTGADRSVQLKAFDAIWKSMLSAPLEERVTYGEILSTRILEERIHCDSIRVKWLDSRELVRTKDGALDRELTYANIKQAIDAHPTVKIFVVQGFIASDENGSACTLGRGGSDYSASIYAAAIDSRDLQIWTDVPGVMTTNPKDAPAARTVPSMSYEAAFCLAEHGAKVLYAPSVRPAWDAGIPINIRNTFDPAHPGTVVGPCEDPSTVGIARLKGAVTVVGAGASMEDAEGSLQRAGIKVESREAGDGYFTLNVSEYEAVEAVKVLHSLFFEKQVATEVYLAGRGAVGSALLEALDPSLVEVKGIAAHACEDEALVQAAIASKGARRTFVDCTDSEDIYKVYVPLLEAGVNVVTSNRRALAVSYREFSAMKAAARRGGSRLRYNTTVGAALPLLWSVRRKKGDEFLSIEAIVSCTLNYILTAPDGPEAALERAREMGLTEKDPSQDFGGKDALRKLLIIARAAGIPLEESDVEVEPVDPEKLSAGTRLRYISSLERGEDGVVKARIGLREIGEDHPAARLHGTENALSVRTKLHPSPTYVQGAGEGAAIAAAALLDDILA